MNKIRVLIVEDSRIMQQIIIEMLSSDPEIKVIDTALDPFEAREKIKLHNPDVITLDIEMPKMNGVEFLKKLMSLRPMPVVMVSTLTAKGADITIECLEIGAVDYISKPQIHDKIGLELAKAELISKIKNAAKAKIKPYVEKIAPHHHHGLLKNITGKTKIIAMGSSTGGVEAIREIICNLPENFPPVVMVQHMPPGYTQSLANRLNSISKMHVCEARHNQEILPGTAYIAPGDYHLEVKREDGKLKILLDKNSTQVSGHRPSVDVLFTSIANNFQKSEAIGVILTGMGKDGANGMLLMKQAGIFNIGQDEQSCVVYGMPRAAKLNNAVDKEVHLNQIVQTLINIVQGT